VRISTRIATLTLLSGLLITTSLRAADVPFEQKLPDRIAAFMSIPDFNLFKERFSKTSYGQLFDDPQVAEYREQFETMMRKSVEDGAFLPPGIELDDLFKIPSGEVAAAMTLPGRTPSSFVLSLNFGEALETVEQLIDEGITKSVDEGWTEGEVDFQGSRITTLEGPKNPNRPQQQPVKIVLVLEESTLVVSSSLELCQEILDRWDGEADDALADNEVFRHVIDSTTDEDRTPVIRWYVNVADLIKGAFAQVDPTNMVLNVVRGNIARMGVLEFRGIGGSADMAIDGFDSITRTVAWVDEPVTGVLSIFTFPVEDFAPPAWVPASSSMYLAANWDLERAYNSVETLWDTVMGTGSFSAGVQKLATDEKGPKIHIKLDVIDMLDGRMHVMQTALESDDEDVTGGQVVVAIEVKDTEKATALIEKVTSLPGSPLKAREYRDTTIWAAPGPQKGPSISIAHNCLVFASNPDALEAVIRSDPDIKQLVDDEGFKHHTSRMPDRVSLFGMQQSVQQMKLIYNLLKRGPAGEDSPDPAKLPEFGAIKHYFLPGVTYAVPNSRGFEFVTYTLADDLQN